MLTIGTNDPFQFQSSAREHEAQQQNMHNSADGREEHKIQRKKWINCQDALQNGADNITHSNSNAQASQVHSCIESCMETDKHAASSSRINNMKSVFDETVAYPAADVDSPTVGMSPMMMTAAEESYLCKETSVINTVQTPERPQDLMDKVSFGVAKVNIASSAQYRKSYAFKIWRDKGFFPYRLAKEHLVQERRQKSKKHLNAIKVQRDRQNEEAWRAYKSCKATNQEYRSQRSTRGEGEGKRELVSKNDQQQRQLNTPSMSDTPSMLITPSMPHEEVTQGRNMVHKNGIPHYFKTKKHAPQKLQHISKSIPTSVIHVFNNPKPYQNSQAISQIGQEFKAVTGIAAKNVTKAKADAVTSAIPHTVGVVSGCDSVDQTEWSNPESQSTGNVPTTVFTSNLENLYHADTSLRNSGTAFDHQLLNGEDTVDVVTTENTQHYPAQLVSATMGSERNIVSTEDASGLVNHREQDNKEDTNMNSYPIGHKNQCKIPMNKTLTVLDEEPELSEVHSTACTSNLVAAMKNTLSKKYCKENIKPDQERVPTRNRKRRRMSSGDEGQNQQEKDKLRKLTVFTQLDEKVATNLADGIHNVNSEYFPIDALANKAAKETSDTIQSETTKISVEKKVEEIDRARLLLKELFDVTLESDEDQEMKMFDTESRSFGRKNILNHLSLLDRYFAEFQKKLSTEVSSSSTN